MKPIKFICIATLAFITTFSMHSTSFAREGKQMSDTAIKKEIIAESISSYPGNCPCPYSSMKNGARCGKRSAWNRKGGYAPICYESDVSKEMIKEWLESN